MTATPNSDQTPDRPHVRVEPGVRFGEPHIEGVRTLIVAGRVHAGDPVEEVADDYGWPRAQVLVACWHQARHGAPTYRRAWKDWLNAGQVDVLLARSEYGRVMDPPDRTELAVGGIVYGPQDAVEELTDRKEIGNG